VDTLVYARMALTGERDGRRLADLEKRYLSASLRSATKDNLADWGKVNKLKKSEIFSRARYSDPVYAMYAGWDGILTSMLLPRVRDAARHQLTNHPFGRYGADPDQASYLLRREQRVNRVMLKRSARGIRVDDERIADEQERIRQVMNDQADALVRFDVTDPSNRNQLAAALEAADAIPEDYPRTATGKVSTAAKNLSAIDHPAVQAFTAYDDHRRLFTYLENSRLVAGITGGRIHPQVNVLHARTGRMSYSNPALQQFTKPAREALLADPGDEMVSIDWASIEPVVAGNLAGDEQLIAQYESGEKLYRVVEREAGVTYGQAKVLVLAMLYGQGIRSLAAAHGWDLTHAKELQTKVASAMPRTDRFVRWAGVWSGEVGKTWTVSGRIVDVDQEFGYKGSNFTVQGSAYDIEAETLVAIDEAGLSDGLYLSMHDENVVSKQIAPDVARIMLTPPDRLCELSGRTPLLRIDSEHLGERWGKPDD
jgi:DNA polymerase I-like protein with 3'-5' exonuclease and polymerase domains